MPFYALLEIIEILHAHIFILLNVFYVTSLFSYHTTASSFTCMLVTCDRHKTYRRLFYDEEKFYRINRKLVNVSLGRIEKRIIISCRRYRLLCCYYSIYDCDLLFFISGNEKYRHYLTM